MIPPDTVLSIYEIRGDIGSDLPSAPPSFIGLWNEDEIAYLFFSAPEEDYVNHILGSRGLTLSSCHQMKYEDWQTGLPAQGISIGGVRFAAADCVTPPADAILLDPSVVFGDGTHPTTLRCLRILTQLIQSRTVTSVLDLGTGTGILALAASALGVRHVLAVDKNFLAVQTARRNVEANSLHSVIRVEHGEARLFLRMPFDLVAANLPFHVLRDLVVMEEVSLHRFWLVSGINREQGEVLKDLLRERGHELEQEHDDPPWVTFTTVNRSRRAAGS
jgi:ribosomal protein L11 methyltransferase